MFLLFTTVALGQPNFTLSGTNGYTNFQGSMQSYFSGLDLTQVPHDILFDYGLPFIDTRVFDGTSLTPENLISKYDHWKFGYGAMSMGQVNGNNTFPSHIQVFTNLQNHYTQTKFYPMVVTLAKYSKIKDDAISNNLIYEQNEVLYDVQGRAQSPYETHTVFMATIANMRPFSSNVIPVEFDKDWFYSNIMGFERMLVDFGDGNGQIEVTDGFKSEITYPDTGTYTMEFEILTSNGLVRAHSAVRIARLQPIYDLNIPIQGNALHSGVQTQIALGCGRNKLMKPLIYVQGFEFTGLEEFSIVDAQRKMQDAALISTFLNEYDLIFIKFNDAQDDLQRNTEALIEAIHKINALKWQNGSNEPNLVIGESMGGLISRLALRKIEVQQQTNPNLRHDCSRLIVFDSPNQGANVPIAAQIMVDELANSVVGSFVSAVQLAHKALNSKAAQQLLIYHVNDNANGERNELMGLLQMHGNPQQCEVIGVSNGVDNGASQGFSPGDAYVDIDYRITPMSGFEKDFLTGLLYSIIPVRVKVIVKMRSTPPYSATASQPIYNTEAYVSFTWGIKKHYIIAPTTRYVSNMYPYDSSPGGNYNLDGFEIPAFADEYLLIDRFGYIPTPSGLNMPMQMTNPTVQFNGLNVTPTGLGWSTFDQAIREGTVSLGPLANRRHTSFTAENQDAISDVLLNWTVGAAFTPSFSISTGVFNYGQDQSGIKTHIYHTTNTTVENGGRLCVNCDEKVGNSAMSTAGNAVGESFGVGFLRPCSGVGTTTIEVKNGSRLELGKNSTQFSKSHFGNGAHLIIRSGGELRINDKSELAIDQGASITIEAGAIIHLNGADAVLEIGGNMIIPANYTFQHTGSGYVRFRTPSITAGANAKISLIGTGSSDKIMEIADNGILFLPSNIIEFQLENGLVKLGASAVVDVFTKVILKDVNVSGAAPSLYNRFGINAKAGTIVQNAHFSHGTFGLRLGHLSQIAPVVSNCSFSNNNVGIYINTTSTGAQITQSTFNNNLTAVQGEGLNLPVGIESCSILASNVGVSLRGWNLTQFNINNTTIQASQIGLKVFGANLNIQESNIQALGNSNNSVGMLIEGASLVRPRCVNISGFHVGSDVGTNCHLNLASGSTSNFTNNAIGVYVDNGSLSVQQAASSLNNNSLYSIHGQLNPNPEFHKQVLSGNAGEFQFFRWPIHKLKLNQQTYPFVDAQGNFIHTTSPINTWDFTAVNGTITQVSNTLAVPIFIECYQCNLVFPCDAVEEPPYYSEGVLNPANGATGRIVYTSYFPGVELITAIRSALNDISFVPDVQANDLNAVLKLKQLLAQTYTDLTEVEHQALIAAAKYMGLALSNAYAFKQLTVPDINNPDPLSEEELFLVDLIESQKAGAEAQVIAELVIAQAQIYRMAGHYETAINLVNSPEASSAAHNKQGYWSCLLPLEYDYLLGNISDDEYLEMTTQCGNLLQMRKMPYPTVRSTASEVVSNAFSHKLHVFPNPGNNEIQLRIPNFNFEGEIQVQVLDNLGRKVHEQVYTPGEYIYVPELPAGSYHVSLITHNQKFNALWIKK